MPRGRKVRELTAEPRTATIPALKHAHRERRCEKRENIHMT